MNTYYVPNKRIIAWFLSMLLPAPGICAPTEAEAAPQVEGHLSTTEQQYEALKVEMRQFKLQHSKELKKMKIQKLRKQLAKETGEQS